MDIETCVNRELLKYAVSRQMFCRATNQVLDIRKAVMCSLTFESGNTSSFVVIGEAWDQLADRFESLPNATVEVLDGRKLYARNN